MLENQIDTLRRIISDNDLQHYTGDLFWDLIGAVIFSDPIAGVATCKDVKELIFHIPTLLFWDKMKRYLFGTFSCYEEQVKMANKFEKNNEKYNAFVKKQIHLINEIDDDKKVDYYASLTRCFLLTPMDESLYFKLSKFLIICTPEELEFITCISMNDSFGNSSMVSSLYQYGLFTQAESHGQTKYILSDFGTALKQNCLNFDDDLGLTQRIVSYKEISPLNIAESITADSLNKAWNQANIVLNGGSSKSE